mmetsp:Transcript_16276/g.53570  ORF Transcript_16276/g.53570 Transcript_16276/m.53570 type:complete len:403 (+) Transcript_16276:1152-2360(+)
MNHVCGGRCTAPDEEVTMSHAWFTAGVVVDARLLGGQVLAPRRGGLDLQLLPDKVFDAKRGARDRVAPHLEHPPEHAAGLVVSLECKGEAEPARREAPQQRQVDQHRRWPAGVDDGRVEAVPRDDGAQLGRLGLHVPEGVADRPLGCGAVGQRAQEDVVRLRDEDVVLDDLRHLAAPHLGEELRDAVRPVHHREAKVARVASLAAAAARGELVDEDGGDLSHKRVRPPRRRVQHAREAPNLAARVGRSLALVVVVHDPRLPRLVERVLRGEQHVVRAALALAPRRRRAPARVPLRPALLCSARLPQTSLRRHGVGGSAGWLRQQWLRRLRQAVGNQAVQPSVDRLQPFLEPQLRGVDARELLRHPLPLLIRISTHDGRVKAVVGDEEHRDEEEDAERHQHRE